MNDSERSGKAERKYIPAAGFHWLLPLCDLIIKLTGIDRARSALLEQAELRPGQQVLDVGCGTGTLAILSLWFHSHHNLKDNSERRILTSMAKARLADPRTVAYRTVIFGFGHVAYYQASALKLAQAKTNCE
jgi:ubiquinone/menaquinone biosynthesis C-methylase UbiE